MCQSNKSKHGKTDCTVSGEYNSTAAREGAHSVVTLEMEVVAHAFHGELLICNVHLCFVRMFLHQLFLEYFRTLLLNILLWTP
jgi:hypothetical protein